MTPLPKRRWSTRRQGKRRASLKAGVTSLEKCDNCGAVKRSHEVCLKCGFYKKRQVLIIKQKPVKGQKVEDQK